MVRFADINNLEYGTVCRYQQMEGGLLEGFIILISPYRILKKKTKTTLVWFGLIHYSAFSAAMAM